MIGQLLTSPIKSAEFAYKGAVTQLNVKPMTAAALAGIMRQAMPDVNAVSAPGIAAERGIEVKESFVDTAERAESLIRISVETEERIFAIVGTIYRGEPRIVRLFGVPMDAAFSDKMLYVRNQDKPGFVGALGKLLGENGVNIATFSMGRMSVGGEAVCLVSVDNDVTEAVQKQILEIPQVLIVNTVNL